MKDKDIQLLIVDETGLQARLKKPCDINDGDGHDYYCFEAHEVKYLPLTTKQILGATIRGIEVNQYRYYRHIEWLIGDPTRLNFENRRAYQPIEEKEQLPVSEESLHTELTVEWAADKYAEDNYGDDMCVRDFLAGHNHAVASNNLVSLDKVIAILKTELSHGLTKGFDTGNIIVNRLIERVKHIQGESR